MYDYFMAVAKHITDIEARIKEWAKRGYRCISLVHANEYWHALMEGQPNAQAQVAIIPILRKVP